MTKRTIALIMALVFVFALIAGCGSQNEDTTPAEQPSADAPADPETNPPETQAPTPETEPSEEPESIYPVTEETVTMEVYWGGFGDVISYFPDTTYWSGMTAGKMIEEVTNIHIEWSPFERDLMTQTISLMLAGGDYCDAFNCVDVVFPSGMNDLVSDEIAIDLTELVPIYAPDYYRLLQENETFRKEATCDDGSIVCLFSKNAVLPRSGLQVRQDLLDQFGMEVPSTFDEIHDYLTRAKTELGSSTPFLTTNYLCDEYNTMSAAFGVNWSRTSPQLCLQVDDGGNVVASVNQPGLKDYLQLLNIWLNEGLMSDAFINISNERFINDYIYTDDCVMFAGGHNNSMSEGFKALCNTPTIEFVAAPDPKMNADDDFTNNYAPAIGSISNGSGMLITTQCEYPEAMLSWLNYGFTEEGRDLYCFGVENEFYYVDENGEKQYTEIYTNNPDGIPQFIIGMVYKPAGIFEATEESTMMGLNENQINAYEIWSANRDPNGPNLFHGTLTADESAAIAGIESDLITFIDENTAQFVTNARSFDEWDDFIEHVNGMGLDQVLERYQAAYDRYISK